MAPLQVIEKAQLSKSELARLTRFSRPTIQRLLDGQPPRSHVDQMFFKGIMDAIKVCLKERELPLPPNLSSRERDRRIRKFVRGRFNTDKIDFLIG